MMESIELELHHLNSSNLSHLIPSYLFDYFKDELNDRILANLINELDSLIQTIEANNSFKILTLNDDTNSKLNLAAGSYNPDSSVSSSISETVLTSCKSLLSDISNRLNEIFSKYSCDINLIIDLFEKQQHQQQNAHIGIHFKPSLIKYSSRQDLVIYQRAILVQKLSTKHYDLFNLVFRNVFDYYQKSTNEPSFDNSASQDVTLTSDVEPEERMNESQNSSFHATTMSKTNKSSNQVLLENFARINHIL
jgi:hypothetical protein